MNVKDLQVIVWMSEQFGRMLSSVCGD